jgi:hypothetical protein
MEAIMLGNRLIAIALLSLVAATACDDSTGTGNDATLRLANATNSNVDIASGTSVAAGNSNIGFGASSGCVTTNVFEPDLTVSPSGTTNSYASFTPTLRRGESYVAVAYPGFGGAPEFSYIPTSAAVASGQSGLRVFNAVAGSGAYDVYVTAPAAPLGTVAAVGIGFRTASGYLSVPATTNLIRLTNTGTQTVAITSTQIFTAGQNSVLVIAPPTAGSTVPRTFLVNGC